MANGIVLALLMAGLEQTSAPANGVTPPPSESAAAEATAQAQRDDAARKHFDTGIEFFNSGQYDAARVEFEAGLKLNGRPEWLFNLAKVAQHQGKLAEAREFALRYQVMQGAADPEAKALLDSLPPEAARAPQAPLQQSKRLTPAPWALVGVGAGSLLGAIVTSSVALSLSRHVESTPLVLPDYQAAQSEGASLNAASGSLLAIGLGLAAGGTTWLLVRHFQGRQHKTP